MESCSGKDAIRAEVLSRVKDYHAAAFAPTPFVPGESRVHYAGRVFDQEELVSLVDSSLDFWLTEGRYAEEFAAELSEYLDVDDVILTNSGSSANLCAVSALTSVELGDRRLRPGDEVIAVAAAFPATVAPLVQNGLVPVFVDVELGTYNIQPDAIEAALSDRTRAIVIAHTLGNPFDLGRVMELAKKHNLWVIEDNCDALGSRYNGRLTGTFGHLATLSFYPAHHITTGEGGAVVTNDETLGRIVRSFRDWGSDCYCSSGETDTCGRRFTQQYGNLPRGYDHKYVYSHMGYNLKMTDMQAAIGCAQIRKLDGFVARRKHNYARLYEGLSKHSDRLVLFEPTPGSDPSWFAFVITVREGQLFNRDALTAHLEKNRIETRNLFSGNLLCHPAFMDIQHRVSGSLDNTNTIMTNTFFVGVYPGLRDVHIDYMLMVFDQFFEGL